VQIWVDAHRLLRQIRYQVPIPATSAGAAGGTGAATATITFSGYGAPVSITPPPAGQTADITSQVLQQGRTASG
jgi:hypothetical protein